jgi:hypothetical protein
MDQHCVRTKVTQYYAAGTRITHKSITTKFHSSHVEVNYCIHWHNLVRGYNDTSHGHADHCYYSAARDKTFVLGAAAKNGRGNQKIKAACNNQGQKNIFLFSFLSRGMDLILIFVSLFLSFCQVRPHPQLPRSGKSSTALWQGFLITPMMYLAWASPSTTTATTSLMMRATTYRAATPAHDRRHARS